MNIQYINQQMHGISNINFLYVFIFIMLSYYILMSSIKATVKRAFVFFLQSNICIDQFTKILPVIFNLQKNQSK